MTTKTTETPNQRRLRRKDDLICALAEYLSGPRTAERSIRLLLNDPNDLEWAAIRNAANISRWATIEETEAQLRELLS